MMLVFLLLINIVYGEDIHLNDATFNSSLIDPKHSDHSSYTTFKQELIDGTVTFSDGVNVMSFFSVKDDFRCWYGANTASGETIISATSAQAIVNCLEPCYLDSACQFVNYNMADGNCFTFTRPSCCPDANDPSCVDGVTVDGGYVGSNNEASSAGGTGQNHVKLHLWVKTVTASPTTSSPTTSAPTIPPPTGSPTTAAPTTAAPTTAAPTTGPHEVVFEVGFDNGYHGQTGGSFQNAVKVAISAALGVSQSEFTFSDVLPGPGTVRVLFRVTSFPTLSAQESQDIFDQIITNFAGSGDSNLVAISKKPITVSNIGETDLEFTRAPTNSDPTSSPTTKSPTTSAPVTRSPTIPGYTYAPTGHPTEFPTEAPTLPPTVPPPPPVNILQTTVEEKCTVSDFTKIMLAVASTLCGLVAFMAITFWFILERSRGGSGFSSGRVAPSGTFAEVGKPIGHSLFKSRKMKATPEEIQGLVNRRGGDREV